MGVGSWGTDQELEALIREGVRYSPDIVIYQFCGNDLGNNLQPRQGLKMNDRNKLLFQKPFRYELVDGKLDLRSRDGEVEVSAASRVREAVFNSALAYSYNRAAETLATRFGSPLGAVGSTGQGAEKGGLSDTGPNEGREPKAQTRPALVNQGVIQKSERLTPWWIDIPMNPTSPDFLALPAPGAEIAGSAGSGNG